MSRTCPLHTPDGRYIVVEAGSGAPDLNRKMAANSPYAEWFAEVGGAPG